MPGAPGIDGIGVDRDYPSQISEGTAMDSLSAGANTDIGNRIGALELNDFLESCRDGSLEAAGANAALGPTLGNYGCGAVPHSNYCVKS